MSRAAMARANFKKYKDITNPLASQDKLPDSSANTNAWRDSDNRKPSDQEEDDDDDDEEEDPFGLGALMSSATREDDRRDAEEEEEDPFGLGAIMDEADNGDDTPNQESRKRSYNKDGSSRKAQKTTADATTGGYFKGTTPSTSAQSALEEAKRQPFRAADSFSGAKQGYVFQKGPLGLGYYADKEQIRASEAAAAAAASVEASRAHSRGPEARSSVGGPAAGTAARTGDSERKPQAVDVAASLLKLKGFILKPKKAAKAASLMADLMAAQMRPENARMFFMALKPLAEEPAGEAALAAGEGGARAFRLLAERASEWVVAPSDGVRAVTWELLFGLRHDTKTDDSFTFARAIKRLRQAIEALGDVTGMAADEGDHGEAAPSAAEGGVSLSLERKTALILIMKEAFKSYHLAWARSSIEPAFKAAADRRRLFPAGELRDTLDNFTDVITKRQRNPGGLMAPPTRSVRAHNSTAHPMLNKRSDVIR